MEVNEIPGVRLATTPHVFEAIRKVMEEIGKEGVSKDRTAQGYKFRGIDDVLNALNPILARASLVIIPAVLSRESVERESKTGGVIRFTLVEMSFQLVSSVDGSSVTARTFGEAMDVSDKSTNKAMSAAYKYMAFQTFCIPTEGDNDSENEMHLPAPIKHQLSAPAKGPSSEGAAFYKSLLDAKQQSDLRAVCESRSLKVGSICAEAYDAGCRTAPELFAYIDGELPKRG